MLEMRKIKAMNELPLFQLTEIVQQMTREEAAESCKRIDAKLISSLIDVWHLKRRKGYEALGYKNLVDCVQQECASLASMSKAIIYKMAGAGEVLENLISSLQFVDSIPSEGQLRPIVEAELEANEQIEVWQAVSQMAEEQKVKITAQLVEQVVEEYVSTKVEKPMIATVIDSATSSGRTIYTLTDWQEFQTNGHIALDDLCGQLEARKRSKFNHTNENVEWAHWTWNPVTGCLHDCPYCYARDIANRHYDHLPIGNRFQPVIYPERLHAPANTTAPNVNYVRDSVERIGQRNVFTCSMADLFGKWVPQKWIEAVLEQVWNNPQWTFLFLTKFPIRMAEFEFPPNSWIGTTVDRQWAVERAEKAFRKIRAGGYKGVAWLSCEPMMERLTFTSLDMFDWLVMGGASASSQTPAYLPPVRDTIHLVNQADLYNIPIYMKTNLGIAKESRIREYPV